MKTHTGPFGKKKISKSHHYLPRFYLNGFTDEEGSYFVLDKLSGNIWRSKPENSFFENYRNTSVIEDAKTGEKFSFDFVEDFLSQVDNKAAEVINSIRDTPPHEYELTLARLFTLRFFMTSIFWRTPANDDLRNRIIEEYSFEDLGFGLFDKVTGERMANFEKELKDMDFWKKMYPAKLMFTAFSDKFIKLTSSECRMYYQEYTPHIVTDNPVILFDYKDFSSFHEEYLFPISSKAILISSKKYKPQVLPPLFSIKVDMLLYHQAKRYVAGTDKKYLELLYEDGKKNSHIQGRDTGFKYDLFNYFY